MLSNGLYKRYLPAGPEVLKYAREKRFLTSETLQQFHIGQCRTGDKIWMTMPTIHGEQLRGIKMRNTRAQSKKDRYSNEAGSVAGLFNYNGVTNTTQPVLIVKGEIAVMVLVPVWDPGLLLRQAGKVRTTSTKNYSCRSHSLSGAWSSATTTNDRTCARRWSQAARRRAEIFKAEMRLPPDPYVGIDDWVIAQPQIAIPTIKSWME